MIIKVYHHFLEKSLIYGKWEIILNSNIFYKTYRDKGDK
jgi:hypothetical protein